MRASFHLSASVIGLTVLVCIAGDRAEGFSYFTFSGANVVWPGGQSVRDLSPSTFPPGSDPDMLILASMGLWNLVPASDFEYLYYRLPQDYPVDHFDGFNDTVAVPAAQLDPGVLGVTFMVNSGAEWFDMDIFFSDFPENVGWHMLTNPDCETIANPSPDNGFSFFLVALHELGHGIGLGHDPMGDEPSGSSWFIQTMNPRYPNAGPVGQQHIVELHTEDRRGARFLYPHSGASEPPVVDLANAGYTTGGVVGQAVPVFFDTPNVLPEILPAEQLTVRSVIENFGATNEFNVRQGFYLSTDATIDTGDLLVGELLWDLAFEDAIEFDVVIDMPADIAAGAYYVGSIFDDLDEIAEDYEDNNAVVYCETLTVNQLGPIINELGQEIVPCGQPYTGPVPTVTRPLNMSPIAWSLDNPEPGMTIDPNTGIVSWPGPVRSPFLYTIYVRATNAASTSTQILFLGVDAASPEIVSIPDAAASCGQPYTGPRPLLTEPACMGPIVNWSLDEGPFGMTIDFNTGVVSWPAPVPAAMPYTVTVRATNAVGNGSQTWQVTVTGGDTDADGDVDLPDFAVVRSCLSGPAGALGAGCECADTDGDGDVDLADLARFVLEF